MAQNVKLIDPSAGNSEATLPLSNFVLGSTLTKTVIIGDGVTVNSTWRLRVSGNALIVEELTGVNTWTNKGSFV